MASPAHQGGRGVSSAVAVAMMVTMTVVLTAVFGTFVLGIGNGLEGGVWAEASVDCDHSDGEVTVTFSSNVNAEAIEVVVGGTTDSLTEVGQSVTRGGLSGDVEVTVTAVAGDRQTLVRTETCEGL